MPKEKGREERKKLNVLLGKLSRCKKIIETDLLKIMILERLESEQEAFEYAATNQDDFTSIHELEFITNRIMQEKAALDRCDELVKALESDIEEEAVVVVVATEK